MFTCVCPAAKCRQLQHLCTYHSSTVFKKLAPVVACRVGTCTIKTCVITCTSTSNSKQQQLCSPCSRENLSLAMQAEALAYLQDQGRVEVSSSSGDSCAA
jgi:hypothetical protein